MNFYRSGVATAALLAVLSCCVGAASADDSARELFGDPNFERGFSVGTGGKPLGVLRLPFESENSGDSDESKKPAEKPVWALATHASKYDLTQGPIQVGATETTATTPGQTVSRRKTEDGSVVLTLGVSTDKEYAAPRTADQLWIHLLLERNWSAADAISFGEASSVVFSADARIAEATRLMSDAEFDPGLHATQTSVYFAISNANPDSPDYRDYIWFGVSFFDDRTEIQSNYVEIDGDPKTIGTGKLIYRLGEQKTIDDVCGGVNPYFQEWTHIEIDLARYVDAMLSAARERGMLTRTAVSDLKLVHFNFGWETPGTYRAALEMKNLRLVAVPKNGAK